VRGGRGGVGGVNAVLTRLLQRVEAAEHRAIPQAMAADRPHGQGRVVSGHGPAAARGGAAGAALEGLGRAVVVVPAPRG